MSAARIAGALPREQVSTVFLKSHVARGCGLRRICTNFRESTWDVWSPHLGGVGRHPPENFDNELRNSSFVRDHSGLRLQVFSASSLLLETALRIEPRGGSFNRHQSYRSRNLAPELLPTAGHRQYLKVTLVNSKISIDLCRSSASSRKSDSRGERRE